MSNDQIQCQVKWFKPDLQYGFAYDDDEVSYFLHKSEFQGDLELLTQGDVIKGTPKKNEKGMYLSEIRLEL